MLRNIGNGIALLAASAGMLLLGVGLAVAPADCSSLSCLPLGAPLSLGLFSQGLVLALHRRRSVSTARRVITGLLSGLILVLAGRFLLAAGSAQAGVVAVGLALLLLGGATLLDAAPAPLRRAGQLLAIPAGLVAFFSFSAFLFGTHGEAAPPVLQDLVSMWACLALVGLAVGSWLMDVSWGLGALLVSASAGGVAARRLLPAAALIPLSLGRLRLMGEGAGIFEMSAGMAFSAVAVSSIFGVAVLFGARTLNRFDDERRRHELERQEVGRELVRVNQFLDAIVENIPNMIFVKDAERLSFVRLNRAGEELLGIRREEVLGKTDLDFFPPEQAEFFRAKDREALDGGRLVSIEEEPNQTRHGERWLRTKKVPIVLEGRPAFLLGISEDITDSKRAGDALRKWAHLFEHAEWGVALARAADDTVELMNPAFARMHGFPVEGLTGRPLSELFAPAARAELAQQLERANEVGFHTFESVHLRQDGSTFPVLINATTVRGPEGAVLYRAFNVQDITLLKRTELDLRRARDAAEATSRELESFSYSVSHDLRAPLRSIDGFSQALLDDHAGQLDEEGLSHLRRIRASAQRMAQLIDDLLDLARVTRVELRQKTVDLSQVARAVLTALEADAPARKVELSIEAGLEARGDEHLLQLVLENLLGNSWKFTRGKEPARITFGNGTVVDGKPCFYVRDNGAGFDMRYVQKLFGPFQRLHGMNEFEGTGNGLATVQRIISRHGGRVWAEGAVGQGATFFFTLPPSKAQEHPEPGAPS